MRRLRMGLRRWTAKEIGKRGLRVGYAAVDAVQFVVGDASEAAHRVIGMALVTGVERRDVDT